MVKGKKYLVKYRLKGVHRKDHRFIGVFLGTNLHTGAFVFSLRPSAGTSELRKEDVKSFIESSQPCKIVD